MSTTIRHQLPLLAAGQAQKEITHNEALLAIDRQLQIAVESRTKIDPPMSPAIGTSYIIPDNASGVWAGHTDSIAFHDGQGWSFASPVKGSLAWVADEAMFAIYDAGWFSDAWPVAALRIAGRNVLGADPTGITCPAGGAIVDIEGRSAIEAIVAVLRAQGIIV